MPWHVSRSDECPASKPWAVVRDSDNEVEGCHETEEAAKKQQAALYAAERAEKSSEPRHKFCPILDAKALDDGEVSAMFSVFGNVDLVGDRIKSGAFTKTLKRWQDSKDPIPVIVSHQWDDVWAHIGYAEPADVKQMPRGVVAKAKLDVEDNPLAAQAHKLMKRGTFKGWSFGYTVPKGGEKLVEEKSGEMVNEIKELDLIEIGPTLKGANPEAQLQAAKSWLAREEEEGELGKGKFSVHLAHALEKPPESPPSVPEPEEPAPIAADKSFNPSAEDATVKEPKAATTQAPDPLYRECMGQVRDIRTDGAVRNPPAPEPEPEPPSVKDLRREHRDLMLALLR
jgi:HK97 family phage prohead protease